MISLPQIPTDNLYKFMSIFGLVSLTGGLLIPPILDEADASWTTSESREAANRIREYSMEFGKWFFAEFRG